MAEVTLILEQLAQKYNEGRFNVNLLNGSSPNQYGVSKLQLKQVAQAYHKNHELGLQLWQTNNTDAMLLATMLIDIKQLSRNEIIDMLTQTQYLTLIDELSLIVYNATCVNELYDIFLNNQNPFLIRVGFNLINQKLKLSNYSDIDIDNLLKRIEKELKTINPVVQSEMNRCLCNIGILIPNYTNRCLHIAKIVGPLINHDAPPCCFLNYAVDIILEGSRRKVKKST